MCEKKVSWRKKLKKMYPSHFYKKPAQFPHFDEEKGLYYSHKRKCKQYGEIGKCYKYSTELCKCICVGCEDWLCRAFIVLEKHHPIYCCCRKECDECDELIAESLNIDSE